jgi:hypothetical protein
LDLVTLDYRVGGTLGEHHTIHHRDTNFGGL